MEDLSKKQIVEYFVQRQGGGGSQIYPAIEFAKQVVLAYAGSANSDPGSIPLLFTNMVKMLTTGEVSF